MKRDEERFKDVAISTTEGDGDSNNDILCAKGYMGFERSNPEGSIQYTNGSTIEKDISQECHINSEEVASSGQGEGTLPVPLYRGDTQYETQEFNDHLGDTAKVQEAVVDRGEALNPDRLIERFNDLKIQELKPRTRQTYIYVFKGFAEFVRLEKKSKRDLQKRGRRYILDYLRKRVPKKSWKRARAGLQAFWEDVLELDFPLRRSDIKKFPRTGRCFTPPDKVILQWAEALEHERDIYLRLIWLLIAQNGWRPSHVGGVRWKHVHRDDEGKPLSIMVEPKDGEFKTDQPVAVHLSADVQRLIMEWEKETERLHGSIGPDDLLLPWRSRVRSRHPDWNRPLDSFQCWRFWDDLRIRHKIGKLTPRDCRHWVATACRKAGLSKAATAYLQGHDSSGGSTMRDWYDNITPSEAITEQSQIIPDGALGTLLRPVIKVEGAMPAEAKGLFDRFMKGELGSIEMMTGLEELKRRIKDDDILRP